MKDYSLQERVEFYKTTFPTWPAPRADERWIDGMWVLGNDYRGSGYYGSYPPNYLKRVLSMFPDAEKILHLFSGSLPKGEYIRFDLNQNLDAEVHGNAHNLSESFPSESFDLVLADPPYSSEDADHYGIPMVNRNLVIKEVAKILIPNGYLIWLDQVLPMFRKD